VDGWDPVGGEDDQDPADGAGGRHRLRSAAIMLVLAVVVAVIAAVTTNLVLSHGHTTAASSASATTAPPSPAPTSASPSPASASPSVSPVAVASQQAAAVNKLLSSSAAARTALQHAVSQAGSCTNVSGAVIQIRGVVNERNLEDKQAAALATSALAGGATLRSDLLTVLRDSLTADKAYLSWAEQQAGPGCAQGAPSSAFTAADQQAGVAKVAFLKIWNPIAAKYGLPQESATSI
jgi:hypothetical protein